jgi:altered-inheritance-of-mitochondria protein 13
MGASQSKSDTDEKVFYNETPIQVISLYSGIHHPDRYQLYSFQFGQDVVHHLSDHLTSPETTPDRQTTLDAHIRSRIQADLQHLREQEEHVQHEIEIALEKENLEREKSMAGEVSAPNEDESTLARVKSSAALMGDLEEIRNKVDRFHSRQEFEGIRTVKEKGEAVVSCYRYASCYALGDH